jgi:hypothetical protein
MALMIFPVPAQLPQALSSARPEPRQTGHNASPVPGVPSGASSPGRSALFGKSD